MKYLPTLAELLDRLSIVLLKAVFVGDGRDEYLYEIELIENDIDEHIKDRKLTFRAEHFRIMMMMMLSNRFIWENEATVRSEGVGFDRLRVTHSINGVRTTAKNRIAAMFGERTDKKVDCLAADLPPEFGNWDVFG